LWWGGGVWGGGGGGGGGDLGRELAHLIRTKRIPANSVAATAHSARAAT